MKKKRCAWPSYSGKETELDTKYHDEEWGVPVHDDRLLFEFLILEGAQAGLSWTTILKKRDDYRKAYDNFEPAKVAKYTEAKQQKLLQNAGIVRNRLKVAASVTNAKAFLKVQKEFGSFDKYIWGFVGNKPIQNSWKSMQEVPATTQESDAMSKDLKKRGFKFVGPTICYAFMQAVGLVNDHTTDCFRYKKPKWFKNSITSTRI
ncbi:MAG: DNA-3-methyladenine glycosylase I [Nitrospinae bacterium]|nr:DNA-3-methyladenine glycosylase I [Nitrospinota bacterium]MDA1110470.1 DNA-3-methyladenine glycosylase I [Nitrospinota bacterium]